MYKTLSTRRNGSKQTHLVLTAFVLLVGRIAPAIAQQVTGKAPPPESAAAPKLEVSTSEWDFGVKWAGEKAETTITLRNVGDAPLHIDRVKTSCGCTAARVKDKVLQPGETQDVEVSYNTKKRTENVNQKVDVYSDDPQHPVTTILVKGRVRQWVKTNPPRGLQFGALGRDEIVTKSVEIECAYEEPLKLKLGEFSSRHFDVRLEEVEEGKRYKLSATTNPPLPDGTLRANVRLLTGMELVPEIPLRIWGSVQPPVAVTPKVLYVFGQMQKPVKRVLRVATRREKPLKIMGVTSSDPAIKTEILPAGRRGPQGAAKPNVTMIRVTLPPADEFPAGGATITIATDDEEYPELTVPVRTRAAVKASRSAQKKARVAPRPGATKRPKTVRP
ncbi:MAG: DUF1573 domain-containing protein [Phycisphaerae bacterium]